MTDVIDEIAAERRRQVEAEGWTADHDDEHADSQLVHAAVCYALGSQTIENIGGQKTNLWPSSWSYCWWKPKDRRRDLVRAAALLVAEIERMDRKET